MTGQEFRTREGRPLRFRFDGQDLIGYEGDTLAAALLANGVHRIATSIRLGRPRGIFAAGVEEPNALVQIEEPFPEPMLPATVVELYDGLVARGLSGRGRLADSPDPSRYDAVHAHCDVLVVGAGPAGLACAADAAATGARVILVDEHPPHVTPSPGVRFLSRTTAFGYYDDNYVVAVERRTNHLGRSAPAHLSRERIWRIRAREVVLATGAHERSLAFADNDRPGVMLAGAARTYLNRYGVLAGRRAVVMTTNDSAYEAALDLHAAGVSIAAIADLRPTGSPSWAQRCASHGIDVLDGHAVAHVAGAERVSGVTLRPLSGGPARDLDADLLLVSGGWNPVVALYSQAGGSLTYDPSQGAFRPLSCRQALRVVPFEPPAGITVWSLPGADPETSFVDLQRDVTVADLERTVGAGMRSVEHVKRYTTAGTAHDQGRTSGTLTSGVVAGLLGVEVGELGTTTFRPPYAPVSFAALAGRDRGMRYDPVRMTALHGWHEAQGALFENVGQWKRPWYYPRDGEDLVTAVLRECRAAREGVATMDASTLGKIEVSGPDAAVLLDRLYTNMMSTLAVGAIRYGVMCRPDGMVFDDGTVSRHADDRFLVTTTTGNAAAVLDWMEEWLQTEWPQLRVHCTSVTEQWATIAVVGPRSRDVLAVLSPGLDVSRAGFGFMTWRDTDIAGVPGRACRISFSGELAYELNVSWWDARTVWEAVLDAGAAHGITPYGTETMHVLRAEKGYPIIGQDTDGTVTPYDLGLGWAVSKKKADFLGKRSFARADTARADRKQLVGLLPDDGRTLLPEGAHLIETPVLPAPPVPTLGHVTSAYHSAALGRTFALALIRGGRDRIGQRVYAPLGDSPLGDSLVPVTITSPVLYDPEGTRRDG